jgi:chloramphenicol 3-O-phosphotransferase
LTDVATKRLPGELLILTGPPGAGKSTIAEALAAASEPPVVHLPSDRFWRFIKKGVVPPYLPAARHQNAAVVAALAAAGGAFARNGYFVILDGVVGPWFLDPFRRLGVSLHYVVLRPSLTVALARAQGRGAEALTLSGPIRDLYRQFSALGEFEAQVIDTSDHTAEDTVAAICAALAEGKFRLEAT